MTLGAPGSRFWRLLVPFWCHLGSFWLHVGTMVGPKCNQNAIKNRCWILYRFFDGFVIILGCILAPCWEHFGTLERPEARSERKRRCCKNAIKSLGFLGFLRSRERRFRSDIALFAIFWGSKAELIFSMFFEPKSAQNELIWGPCWLHFGTFSVTFSHCFFDWKFEGFSEGPWSPLAKNNANNGIILGRVGVPGKGRVGVNPYPFRCESYILGRSGRRDELYSKRPGPGDLGRRIPSKIYKVS